jgi:hypothetical protein
MKRIIIAVLLVFCSISSVFAGMSTINLLNGATTTGAGSAECFVAGTFQNWKCDVILTGSPTAVTVRYEGSEDRVHFDPTGMATCACSAAQLAAGVCSYNFCSVPTRCIRANLITLTGGTTPTVSVYCTGAE